MATKQLVGWVLALAAINWGLVGLLDMNLVNSLLGATGLENIVYILVGVSGVYLGATHMNDCKVCSAK